MATLHAAPLQALSDEALVERLYELSCDDVYPATLAAEVDRLVHHRLTVTYGDTEPMARLRMAD
jgi:hypothetical protein